jgi:hypothetical protein
MKNITSAVKLAGIFAIAFASTISTSAQARTMLGQTPPPSLIVNAGGLEWVYASPCDSSGDNRCGSVTLHNDFQFATNEQWTKSFANYNELAAAFKPNGTVLCAAAYFSNEYNHCDFSNVQQGLIWNSPIAAPGGAYTGYGETFLVRALEAEVPEPASIVLIGLGLAGFAAARRQTRK